MANAAYPAGKEYILQNGLDSLDIRVIIIDTNDYTYNAAHEDLADVAEASRVAVSGAMTSLTFTDGQFDADDVVIETVSGDVSEALILYYHTGTEATSTLLFYLDTVDSGLPVTPNGGDVTITWGAYIAAL